MFRNNSKLLVKMVATLRNSSRLLTPCSMCYRRSRDTQSDDISASKIGRWPGLLPLRHRMCVATIRLRKRNSELGQWPFLEVGPCPQETKETGTTYNQIPHPL